MSARKNPKRPPADTLDWDALGLPKHKRLQLQIEQKISSGEYAPGDRLPTEKELMAAHGLSHATVSRAMRELAKAGLVTRKRRLGSFVSDRPRNFTTQTSPAASANALGFFHGGMPSTFHPYFTALIDGFIRAAGDVGMSMKFVASRDGDLGIDAAFLRHHGIAGFATNTAKYAEVEMALEHHIPVVLLSDMWRRLKPDRVMIDRASGLSAVLRHFRDEGHKRVAIIDVRRRVDVSEIAAEVFGCLPWSAPVDEVIVDSWTEAGAREAFEELGRLPKRPTAAFVFDDYLLMHFLRVLAEEGVSTPDDLAVIGRGTPFSAQILGEGVSLLETDPQDIAVTAVELLTGQIKTRRPPGKIVSLAPKLIVRSSG